MSKRKDYEDNNDQCAQRSPKIIVDPRRDEVDFALPEVPTSDKKDSSSSNREMNPSKMLAGSLEQPDATPMDIPTEVAAYNTTSWTAEEIIRMPVFKAAGSYNTSHKNRGKCVIFNHETFENGHEPRWGTNRDVERVKTTFGRFGFDVIDHQNLKFRQIEDEIFKLSQEDHSDNDCLCIFVLTHGHNNDLIASSDAFYSSEMIWRSFTADKCPTLAGKPKLFFFQACRGAAAEDAVTLQLLPLSGSKRLHVPDAATRVPSYTIPTFSDFLIAHGSVHGFVSWRHIDEGSWFVQTLCKVIDEFGETTDLLKMLTMTTRIVATDYETCDKMNPNKTVVKQIPSITSTLTRDMYLKLNKVSQSQ